MPRLTEEPLPKAKTALRCRWRVTVDDYVTAASLSPDGTIVAVSTGGGEITALEAATGATRWRREAHRGGTNALAFAPSAPLLASGGHDGRARLWSDAGEPIAELPSKDGGWVEHVAWSATGDRLASASGRFVRLWTPTGAPLFETPAHASTVTAIGWGDEEIGAACYGGVYVWPVAPGANPRVLPWKGSLISMAWSPDGKIVACGSQDASVHFWRLSTGQDSEMRGYPFKPRALAWDAESSLLATTGDATATLWDFRKKGPEGTKPIQLRGHKALITAAAFARHRCLLATGAEDMGILIWEPRRGPKPIRFAFLDDEPTALVWGPRGDLFATDASGRIACFEAG